jgi:hypothetical protein
VRAPLHYRSSGANNRQLFVAALEGTKFGFLSSLASDAKQTTEDGHGDKPADHGSQHIRSSEPIEQHLRREIQFLVPLRPRPPLGSTFEVLNDALVPFRSLMSFKRTEISTLPGLPVFLSGIESILARFQFPNHDDVLVQTGDQRSAYTLLKRSAKRRS